MSPDPDSHNVLIDGSRRFRLPDVGYQPMIGEYTNLDPGIRWYLERDPADRACSSMRRGCVPAYHLFGVPTVTRLRRLVIVGSALLLFPVVQIKDGPSCEDFRWTELSVGPWFMQRRYIELQHRASSRPVLRVYIGGCFQHREIRELYFKQWGN